MAKEEVKVVVVDDDEDACESLGLLLELDGYSVRTATNAARALAAVEEHEPLCVLLDLGLPDEDGCVLARQLRDKHGPGLVLVAVTGWTRNEDRERAEASGIDFILSKPLHPGDLRKLLPPIV